MYVLFLFCSNEQTCVALISVILCLVKVCVLKNLKRNYLWYGNINITILWLKKKTSFW